MLEPFPIHSATGQTIYVCVFNRDGQVFDFDDNTWKEPDVAVDPYIDAPALPNTGGADFCDYLAEIDLGVISPGPEVLFVRPKAFVRQGGSNDLLTDEAIYQDAAWCVFGRSYRDDPRVECVFKGVNRRDTDPESYQCSVGMISAGQHMDLAALAPDAECEVVIRQIGSGADHFTLTATAPAASGRFEMTRNSPNFTANRGYYATITISAGSWTFSKTFSAFG